MLVEEKNSLKGWMTGGMTRGTKEEKEGWKDEKKEVITTLSGGETMSEV